MSEVADAVKKIVADHLNVDASRVTPEATFIDELGADSLDAIELLMIFERVFSVDIPEEVAVEIITVKDAIDYIERRRAA
jgi:acyl carrier protein